VEPEFLFDLAGGTATSSNLTYPVRTKRKTEIQKGESEAIEIKSVKMRMTYQNTSKYNLGNDKNFD